MKLKILLFMAIALVITQNALSQNAYYSSISIVDLKIIEGENSNNELKIYPRTASQYKKLAEAMSPFLSDSINNLFKTDSSYNQFKRRFKSLSFEGIIDNPFFIISSTVESSDESFTSLDFSKPKSLISSIGGLDVTNYADGIAKFLVNRTKAELNTYFFAGFQEKMKESPELQYLFPNTAGLLNVIGDEIYQYNTYINSLRNAFELDLTNIYSNFRRLINTPDYKKAISKVEHLNYFLQSGFYIVDQLKSKVHPAEIIHNWDIDPEKDTLGITINSSLKLLDIYSQSLKSKDSAKYWVSPNELKLLLDEKTFRIYLGLTYIQHKNEALQFNNKNLTYGELMKNLASTLDSLDQYKTLLNKMISKADEIELELNKLSAKNEDKPDSKDIYNFINSSIDFIELSGDISELPYIDIDFNKVQFDKYIWISRNCSNIYQNVNSEKYGLAIANLTLLIDTVFTKKMAVTFAENKYSLVKNLSDEAKDELIKTEKDRIGNFKNLTLKYGTFMASVTEAETSEEVASAIESVAMPVGSFRVKRTSQFNMALNGYLGGFAGYEYIPALKSNSTKPNLALSAPVGISFSWTGKNCNEVKSQKQSFGFFVSLIDVGAIASYRFGDDSTAIASTIQLKDIVSPGFSLVWNVRNAPISIMAGAQMGPVLRKVYATDIVKEDNIYVRYGLSVVVDIPILNLSNKKD